MLGCHPINLLSKYRKVLVGLSIGIGLGLFFLSGMTTSFLDVPFERVGFVALVLGIIWFLIERGKIGFGKVASVLTVVLMPIATLPLYIIFAFTMGVIVLQTTIDGLALLFIGSGLFAVGLIGVYINRKPKKLGFFFIIQGLLFLLGAPLANWYQVLALRWGTWIATPYQGYVIPLILVSVAFFLLGSASILHVKSRIIRQNMEDTESIEHGNTELDSETRSVAFYKVGFICLILSSMSLIGAAVAYAPNGPSPIIWGVMGTPLGEYPLSLIILSVALFVLGPVLMLHEKSKGRGFSLVLLGSFGLMFASFAHGYRILALEKIEAGESYFRFVNPLREYTLPIVLVSVVFLILGYTLMLSKSRVRSDNVSSRARG